MQGYRKINKDKVKTEENEIRITSKGSVTKYCGYARRVLERTDLKSIEIRATGNAIVKALILIEMVKRQVGNLHQLNRITSIEIVDEFEPLVEGLEKMEQRRRVTCFDCTLSKEPLDTEHYGYQVPEPKQERERNDRDEKPKGQPRTYNQGGEYEIKKRGSRDEGNTQPKHEDEGQQRVGQRGGFRGGMRGRGFRGGRGMNVAGRGIRSRDDEHV
jgi:DNA-binding protein